MKYIDGNVVSRTNQRYITNLLSATAARVVEDPGDSSEDSDDFSYDHLGRPAGNMDLIKKTLDGISSREVEHGIEAIGRYATVIQLGRDIWQSAPLNTSEQAAAQEEFFDDGSFPLAADVLKAAREAIKDEAERPAPYEGCTGASVWYKHTEYGELLNKWFAKLDMEDDAPNAEQLRVLHAVRDRILQEIALENEGRNIVKRMRGIASEDVREE